MAGYRGPQAEIAFLFFRLVMPIALFLAADRLRVRDLARSDQPLLRQVRDLRWSAPIVGIKAPEIYHQEPDRASASNRSAAPFPTRSTCC